MKALPTKALNRPSPGARLAIAAASGFLVLLALCAGAAADHAKSRPVAEVLQAIVGVRAEVPADARTARVLGREREGSGVIIDSDGLILTIGYLILEASSVDIVNQGGETIPAAVVAYDHATGFGLVRAARPLGVKPLHLGDSSALAEGEGVLAVGFAGPRPLTPQQVVSRRDFAGYWEYLLENAIFTTPAHPFHSGAALLGADASLLGIGSLLVNHALPGEEPVRGNMFVPIEALEPILADLVIHGRATAPSHPWLGVYTDEAEGRVFITRLADDGPGEKAGLKSGDIIVGVDGRRVGNMADFLRKVRAQGNAGTDIPLDVVHLDAPGLDIERIDVRSIDRHEWLKISSVR
jgi:S1-C subfamily serine protease